VIKAIRAVSQSVGRRVAIMADLPGPKMRIGELAQEPIELKAGYDFLLTTHEIKGDAHRVSVSFHRLPQAVKPGDALYLNDGYIQLEALKVDEDDVHTRVLVGGELRSRKGLNLPGIDLGIRAFTEHDRKCLKFALDHGVDAVSQSFVESGEDIQDVREAADGMGHKPFIIAKIERSSAQKNLDGILEASDGIMIARGDLGVEIPIERIALAQKYLMRQANIYGKPVITATQMLESMTTNRRPTRAEATDVANAILDGTDGVMLSGESALGKYPVESVEMLVKIAAAIEPHRPSHQVRELLKSMAQKGGAKPGDIIPYSVEAALAHISPAAVFVPTRSGLSARRITRFRLPVWVVAVSSQESTCQGLQFSYGVCPVCEPNHPENWNLYVGRLLEKQGVEGDLVVLTEGPSSRHPEANNRMEILELRNQRSAVSGH
jgi:pyruvate kinase